MTANAAPPISSDAPVPSWASTSSRTPAVTGWGLISRQPFHLSLMLTAESKLNRIDVKSRTELRGARDPPMSVWSPSTSRPPPEMTKPARRRRSTGARPLVGLMKTMRSSARERPGRERVHFQDAAAARARMPLQRLPEEPEHARPYDSEFAGRRDLPVKKPLRIEGDRQRLAGNLIVSRTRRIDPATYGPKHSQHREQHAPRREPPRMPCRQPNAPTRRHHHDRDADRGRELICRHFPRRQANVARQYLKAPHHGPDQRASVARHNIHRARDSNSAREHDLGTTAPALPAQGTLDPELTDKYPGKKREAWRRCPDSQAQANDHAEARREDESRHSAWAAA